VAVQQSRPSALTWVLAVIELIAALVIARLIVWSDQTPESGHHDHGMPPMPMAAEPAVPAAHWGLLEYTAIGVAAATLIWWLLRRRAAPALLAALAVTVLAASPAMRMLATQSHLIAMVALELLLVIVPLLVLSALPTFPDRRVTGSGGWTVLAVAAALLYSALLIVIHIPAVHRRGAELGSAPLWMALVALVIGVGYWMAVLRTDGRVPVRVRRAVLIGAQEVAAFIGLLSLFGAWGAMDHDSPLGLSAAWDQRLGGVFMIATCAAVAIPTLQRIR
jgi:hypothetical protein